MLDRGAPFKTATDSSLYCHSEKRPNSPTSTRKQTDAALLSLRIIENQWLQNGWMNSTKSKMLVSINISDTIRNHLKNKHLAAFWPLYRKHFIEFLNRIEKQNRVLSMKTFTMYYSLNRKSVCGVIRGTLSRGENISSLQRLSYDVLTPIHYWLNFISYIRAPW